MWIRLNSNHAKYHQKPCLACGFLPVNLFKGMMNINGSNKSAALCEFLLAEDDASQAESIKDWLELDGYSVDWVERGDHAILAVEQHQYDCILLDRGLPKASGDDILKTIRHRNSNTPVIFITAKDAILIGLRGWIWEPMIIWLSHLIWKNCQHGCVPSYVNTRLRQGNI